jgi:hypothetical protein
VAKLIRVIGCFNNVRRLKVRERFAFGTMVRAWCWDFWLVYLSNALSFFGTDIDDSRCEIAPDDDLYVVDI